MPGHGLSSDRFARLFGVVVPNVADGLPLAVGTLAPHTDVLPIPGYRLSIGTFGRVLKSPGRPPHVFRDPGRGRLPGNLVACVGEGVSPHLSRSSLPDRNRLVRRKYDTVSRIERRHAVDILGNRC